jgi:hypothetical protein
VSHISPDITMKEIRIDYSLKVPNFELFLTLRNEFKVQAKKLANSKTTRT